MSALQEREMVVPKQTSPLALRAEPDLEERLEALVKSLGKKRHAVALACLRLGIKVIEESPERFYDAMLEAEKAKSASALALRESELEREKAQAAAKKTNLSTPKPMDSAED
jgi:hypothetical protein